MESKPGENNDRYSIITPALGATATETWNILTVSYDFSNSQSTPVDFAAGIGGKFGVIGVLGGSIKYIPPGKFELNVNGGVGAAAQVEVFDAGITPGKLK